ncbi:phospholipase C [Streptomyces misionensis]|uniref:Phospholipase C n=1 Tax=Streptomyces misionensis TaxID=67331 RepID=A0A1H5H680_9ACTN|nr:hypothetical protein [Streptomyces misionensis]SEE23503.1 phospholipase C [Streptomyces misionensis]
MPLNANDLAYLGETPISIRSAFYQNIYLRLDGTGVVANTTPGGGKVNCQYGPGPETSFRLRSQGSGVYALESVAYPNVFLRMDASGLPGNGAGGGTVNCQYNAGVYEKFTFSAQPDGSFVTGSATFQNACLRMTPGSGVTPATGPGGTVNCQLKSVSDSGTKFILDIA